MQYVPCSLSKIPYVGFSPVRLQTGIHPPPSLRRPGLKREARMHHSRTNFETDTVQAPFPYGPVIGQARFKRVSGARQRGLSSPEALGSPAGYVVPSGHRLLRPHPRLSVPPAALSSSSSRSLPYGLVWAGAESFPNLIRASVSAVPPSVPRRPERLLLAVASPPPLAFAFFVEARLTQCHAHRFGRGSRNEAAKFAFATARQFAGPLPARTFTFELSPPESPP